MAAAVGFAARGLETLRGFSALISAASCAAACCARGHDTRRPRRAVAPGRTHSKSQALNALLRSRPAAWSLVGTLGPAVGDRRRCTQLAVCDMGAVTVERAYGRYGLPGTPLEGTSHLEAAGNKAEEATHSYTRLM